MFRGSALPVAFNPFIAPVCQISGLKGARTHTRACKQNVFRSYRKPTFKTVCVLMQILSEDDAGLKKKKAHGFRISYFIARF